MSWEDGLNTDQKNLVRRIEANAYDAYPLKHKPREGDYETFPMYSYERISSLFWTGAIARLVMRGKTEEEIVTLLQDKTIRYMLDSFEDTIEDFAGNLIDTVIKD